MTTSQAAHLAEIKAIVDHIRKLQDRAMELMEEWEAAEFEIEEQSGEREPVVNPLVDAVATVAQTGDDPTRCYKHSAVRRREFKVRLAEDEVAK